MADAHQEIISQITNRNDNQQASTVDTDALSLADLRALASKEAAEQEQQPERDEQGRFKAADSEPEPEQEGEEDAPVVYRREIDLGDGSGKEVFEADSLEELLDKIADGKAHASRKIREQAAKLKELESKQPTTSDQESDEDDFLLSQEILRKPTEAVKKAFKLATGLDISEFKSLAERVKAMDAAQAQQAELAAQNKAAEAFIAAHPEYVRTEANGKRLSREVESLITEKKRRGESFDYGTLLQSAYDDLTESGLLALKSEDAGNSNADATAENKTERIARAGNDGQVQRKRSSSLVTRARAAAPPAKTGPTEEELYSMPLEKLRQLANQHAAS